MIENLPTDLRNDLAVIGPELVVLGGVGVGLLAGLFAPKAWQSGVATFCVFLALLCGAVLCVHHFRVDASFTYEAFGGSFRSTAFIAFAKVIALVCAAVSLLMAHEHREHMGMQGFEYAPLMGLASLGLMVLLSSNDLLTLYLGLELLSLPSYVLAAFSRDNAKATEAGLKYFVLGALASGFILYGSSLVYGFAGTLSFAGIAAVPSLNIALLFGLILIICGLTFKCSAAPFHMWTPDVYEGAPTPVVAFFATAPKIAAVILCARVLFEPFAASYRDWSQVIAVIAAISMMWGALGALAQKNLKRLLAYSSINNVGFALMGIAAGSEKGAEPLLIFMAIYVVTSLGLFAGILALRDENGPVETIDGLKGLAKSRPGVAIALTALFFSVAGIPPLLGFWGKFYIFIAALDAGLVWLWAVACVATVIAAAYYLNLIAKMWFDEPLHATIKPGSVAVVTLDIAALVTTIGLVFFGILEVAAKVASAG